MSGSSQTADTAKTQTTTPWGSTGANISGLLDRLNATPTGLSGAESQAFQNLGNYANRGNPFASGITSAANFFLGGGDPGARGQLTDTISGKYLDPNTNPFFSQLTNDATRKAGEFTTAQYAGMGRDISGAGSGAGAIGENVARALAPIYANQYNTERGNQMQASGLLGQLDLANKQAGIGAAGQAQNAEMWGPMQMLLLEAQRQGVEPARIAQQLGLNIAPGQAFGTTSQTGVQQMQTPFNPTSLLPLATMLL